MKTVMLVEDEPMICFYLEELISESGLSIVGPFRSVDDSLHFLLRQTPDAAVLDYWLADGRCSELGAELHRRGIPFFIISGTEKSDAVGCDFDDVEWLEKPFRAEAFRMCLERLLAEGKGDAHSFQSAR
jgi:DNA-binding NtrC family response regulator